MVSLLGLLDPSSNLQLHVFYLSYTIPNPIMAGQFLQYEEPSSIALINLR
jgi:hypothetical protein